jgi:hypothetical protein
MPLGYSLFYERSIPVSILAGLNVDHRVTIAKAEVDQGEALDGETVVNAILDRFRQAKENQS